jgi:7-carboxy-7-deazaguanine synthase
LDSGEAGVSANLVEIFSSIQGEGPHVGSTTLFVRFGECDLRCRWCDSPQTWKPASVCRIETQRGGPNSEEWPNPVSVAQIVAASERLEVGAHAFISLTGGEPLLQPEAVAAVARALAERGPRILLETHGLHSEALAAVAPGVDVVSMDWKFTSDVRRAVDPRRGPIAGFAEAHERFLSVARDVGEVVVKAILTPATRDAEIDEMVAVVERVAPEAGVILQPVTPSGPVRETPAPERLLAICTRVAQRLPQVRVIPQTHKSYGVR